MRGLSKTLTLIGCLLLAACGTTEGDPTPRPTSVISGPTLQPSPTILFRSSGELYANETPSGSNNEASANLPSGQYQPPMLMGTGNLSGIREFTPLLSNGSSLNGTLYQAISDQRVPGLLLLGPRAANWGELPQRLANQGYVVLAVSLPRFDYPASEIQTLLESLSVIESVDPSNLAIIAELEASDWALEGCSISGLCKALAVFSPTNRARAEAVISRYVPRPLLVMVAEDDPQSYPVALALASLASTTTQYAETTTGRGAGMLALDEALEFQLMGFLQAALRAVN